MFRVKLSTVPPANLPPPLATYETEYIYTGLSWLNSAKKTLCKLVEKDGKLFYTEAPWNGSVLSRGYHTELVRVTTYSENPRMWKEETSPHQQHFFHEIR
jgi:hypothetical protein